MHNIDYIRGMQLTCVCNKTELQLMKLMAGLPSYQLVWGARRMSAYVDSYPITNQSEQFNY